MGIWGFCGIAKFIWNWEPLHLQSIDVVIHVQYFVKVIASFQDGIYIRFDVLFLKIEYQGSVNIFLDFIGIIWIRTEKSVLCLLLIEAPHLGEIW
jgi:hypothetical protein